MISAGPRAETVPKGGSIYATTSTCRLGSNFVGQRLALSPIAYWDLDWDLG